MTGCKKIGFLAICLFLFSGLAVAQNSLGRIAGSVRDQNGAVVTGAKVTLTNQATQQEKTTTTTSEGSFVFPQLDTGSYTIKVEMGGFKLASYKDVKVDPGQEYSLAATLEVGATTDVIEVTAGEDLVHTTSPELTNTVTRRQILDLPLNSRNTLGLITLQAGVSGILNRVNTGINGGRPGWTQVTQDGINIQDNFIRVNGLDFVPNRPVSDIIGEFTISTNTQGADAAGGSSQVKFSTPQGSNAYHGSVYEFNQNSVFGANTYFNNLTVDPKTGKTLAKPFLNQNQFGGNLGGPILKDKLFFFGYYEGFREAQQGSSNLTIPANDDLLNGVFRYIRPSDNTVQSVNVLGLTGITLDPKVKSALINNFLGASNVNNFDTGNSKAGSLLNTAGFRFNQGHATVRNYWGGKVGYEMNAKNHFDFTLTHLTDVDDRPDIDTIHFKPQAFTSATTKLIVGSWRWSINPALQNELRIGGNFAPVGFFNNQQPSGVILPTALGLTSPVVTFLNQGRDTRTRQYIDNASYIRGNHSFQFGGSLQQVRVRPYNFAGSVLSATFGFSNLALATNSNLQLQANQFPGGSISATDLANANALSAFLGGITSSVSQTFQVKDKTSGFVAGIPNERNYSLNDYALYVQDSWRFRNNITFRLGAKWEYFSPIAEDNGLGLLPVPTGDATATLLNPAGTINFPAGRFYNRDLNNIGPTVGVSWDPFKDGKTAVRFGYTMAFVNEESMTVVNNVLANNAGLSQQVQLGNLFATVNGGLPAPTATFKLPLSYADETALSGTAAAFTIDRNIKQPRVHEVSFSIERELPFNIAVEGRYVGTFGRDIWQGVDLNQTNAGRNQPYVADFLRARSNGFIALNTPNNAANQAAFGCTSATCGVFNPAFNANLPGSQQLTVLTSAALSGGFLTNSTVRSNIQTGQVGELANFYVNGTLQVGTPAGNLARAFFLANPGIYVADVVHNSGFTSYHAFQGEIRRRFKGGLQAQLNYTFSKDLSNSAGTSQSRLEAYLDNGTPQLEKSRAPFDFTHLINGNIVYELPFGKGKWLSFNTSNEFMNKLGNQIIGGWQLNTIVHFTSGAPISILSTRGTFNRAGRSGLQGANSTLSPDQIKALFGIRKLSNGTVYYIDPSVIGPDGRAVGADNLGNTAGFAGQVFFNPSADTLGTLARLQFDGPAQASWDFSMIKRTRITEHINAEFRAEFFNVNNHPSFFIGDLNVNSTTFGKITSLNQNPRVGQLALKINF